MGAVGALQFLLPQIAAATILPALVGAGVSYGTYEFTKPEQNSDSRRLGSIDFTLSENGTAIVTSIFAGVVAAALVSYATLKGLGRLNSFKTKETKAKEVAQEIMNIMPELVDQVIIVLSENSGTHQDQKLRVSLNKMAKGLRKAASEKTSLSEFVRNIFHAHSGSKVLAGRLINDLLDNQSATDLLEYFEKDPNNRDTKDFRNKEVTSSILFGEEISKSKLITVLTGLNASQRLTILTDKITELRKLVNNALRKKQEAEEESRTLDREISEKTSTLSGSSVLEGLKEETEENLIQLTKEIDKAKNEATDFFNSITKLKEQESAEDQIQEMKNKLIILTTLNQSVSDLETLKQQLSQQAEAEAKDKSKINKAAEKLSKAVEELSKLESLAEAAEERLKLAKSGAEILEYGFDVQTESLDVIDYSDAFVALGASPKRLRTPNKNISLNSVGKAIISSSQNNDFPLSQQSKDLGGDFDEKIEDEEFQARLSALSRVCDSNSQSTTDNNQQNYSTVSHDEKSEEVESKLSDGEDEDHHHSNSARSSSGLQFSVNQVQQFSTIDAHDEVESKLSDGEDEDALSNPNPTTNTTGSFRLQPKGDNTQKI